MLKGERARLSSFTRQSQLLDCKPQRNQAIQTAFSQQSKPSPNTDSKADSVHCDLCVWRSKRSQRAAGRVLLGLEPLAGARHIASVSHSPSESTHIAARGKHRLYIFARAQDLGAGRQCGGQPGANNAPASSRTFLPRRQDTASQ